MRRTAGLRMVSLMAAVLVALLAAGLASAKGAHATDSSAEGRIFSAHLIPDLGPKVEPAIAGIAPGGLPWVLTSGHANVSSGGLLEVSVEGLLLGPGSPANLVGTTGPVANVAASVACANGGIVTTSAVALSKEGNAHIHQELALPKHCVGAVVLVRAVFGGNAGPWIAVSGF